MNIPNIGAGLAPPTPAAGGRLYLPGAGEFADTLTVGQIIKGRVLRHYEGNRYLVGFDGNERVVDSGIPLKTGELLHGRVLAVGERVELQRILPTEGDGAVVVPVPEANRDSNTLNKTGRSTQLDELLARYRAHLGPADQTQLAQAVRAAPDAAAMSLAGVMLNKLGLRLTPELLSVAYTTLSRARLAIGATATLTELAVAPPQGAEQQVVATRALADVLKEAMDTAPYQQATPHDARQAVADVAAHVNENQISVPLESGGKAGAGSFAQGGGGDLRYRLFNAQSGGSVSHRIGTLPLLLGGQLIEVDVAMFEQHRDAEQKPAARHRQLVFSLNTEALGAVEVTARVVGARVRIQVLAQDSDVSVTMSGYAATLRSALEVGGWTVDEIVYETKTTSDQSGGAVRSVVEHVISQDSLNRTI